MFDNKAQSVALIYKELGKVQLGKRIASNRIFIQCPLQTHNDSTPSLSINLDVSSKYSIGTWYCFGCGQSGGWNKLAQVLHLQGFDKNKVTDATYFPPNLKDKKKRLLEVETNSLDSMLQEWHCMMPLPFSEEDTWRRISGKLLNDIGVQYAYDEQWKKIRVILPVFVEGELEGAIRAAQDKEKISYLNSKGTWVKTKGLFPFDYVKKMVRKKRHVILVEGPRDALRLIMLGIPALCILGTNNWGEMKRDLVLSLDVKVFIMMDGDLPHPKTKKRAGQEAAKMLKKSFSAVRADFKVINLTKVADRLGKKIDPANAPLRIIEKIKEMIA